MKTYLIPEISIYSCIRDDVLTISLTATGKGDNYSFDELMNLN